MIKGDYGFWDRALHRFVFRAGFLQETLSDAEDLMFGRVLRSIELWHPVFVCGLPRSGTTTLLEVLVEAGHFASLTYRDMPFVLSPLLWHRVSSGSSREAAIRERAHGDGIRISTASPEAFEEVVWKRFWREHYEDDRIRPWEPGEHDPEFEDFLRAHMKKVIAVRQAEDPGPLRYVSKNNLNVARLAALPRPMQEGTVLVPFREPLQQAASMRLQHERFSRLHREQPFAQEYMEAIGHYEFGLGLRPVDFDGWLDSASDPAGLEFWVRYWNASYRHVLDHLDDPVRLVSYARLTEQPASALSRLAEVLELSERDLRALAHRFRPPRTHPVDPAAVRDSVRAEAAEIYERLQDSTD